MRLAFSVSLLIVFSVCAVNRGYTQDVTKPDSPIIRWAKVDTATGNVHIEWLPSTSPDVFYYIIYKQLENKEGFDSIATVPAGSRSFSHENPDVQDRSVRYTVAAVDSSINRSLLPPFHSTMHLTTTYDSCEKRMILRWTGYDFWNEPPIYNVYLNLYNTGYQEIDIAPEEDSVAGEDSDTSGYVYNILENAGYCYFIEALHPDGAHRSTSNIVCLYTSRPRHPAYINADYATVAEGVLIKLSFSYDPLGEIRTFELKRGKKEDNINYTLATLRNVQENPLIYFDTVTYTNINYYYRLNALDGCNDVVATSNVAGHIVLVAEREEYQVNLSWTPYREWNMGIDQYDIYRVLDVTDTSMYLSLPGFITTYRDDVEDLLNRGISGQISYFVIAREEEGNPWYPSAESRSTADSVDITPEVYMPDAFTPDNDPDQLSEQIKPKITFIPKEYRFVIHDRWGGVVFESTDSNEAWDGTLKNGSRAAAGVYVYYLKLTTRGDIIVEKRGTIVLIYP